MTKNKELEPCHCTHDNHDHDYCTGNNCTFAEGASRLCMAPDCHLMREHTSEECGR